MAMPELLVVGVSFLAGLFVGLGLAIECRGGKDDQK